MAALRTKDNGAVEDVSFFEFIDRACIAVLAAEQQGTEPLELGVPEDIYEAIRNAKSDELQRGGTLSLLGLRVVNSEEAGDRAEAHRIVVS